LQNRLKLFFWSWSWSLFY